MAAFVRFYSLTEALAEKIHNLGSDTLKIMLTNVAPVLTNTQKSQLTEIAAGNGYTAGGQTVTITSSGQTLGVYKLVGDDIIFTATGNMATFQWVVLYNDTASKDELICYWDVGTPISLTNTQTFTVDLSPSAGIFTLGA